MGRRRSLLMIACFVFIMAGGGISMITYAASSRPREPVIKLREHLMKAGNRQMICDGQHGRLTRKSIQSLSKKTAAPNLLDRRLNRNSRYSAGDEMKPKRIQTSLQGLAILLFVITACRPQMEELSFETIAQSKFINYRQEAPALFIITNDDEDALAQDVLAEDPVLADLLRQLDYTRYFAVLVVPGLIGYKDNGPTVKRIVRQDDQVTVYAEVSGPSIGTRRKPAGSFRYHLVAVFKQGQWGQQIKFVLVIRDESVAEATHTIP